MEGANNIGTDSIANLWNVEGRTQWEMLAGNIVFHEIPLLIALKWELSSYVYEETLEKFAESYINTILWDLSYTSSYRYAVVESLIENLSTHEFQWSEEWKDIAMCIIENLKNHRITMEEHKVILNKSEFPTNKTNKSLIELLSKFSD